MSVFGDKYKFRTDVALAISRSVYGGLVKNLAITPAGSGHVFNTVYRSFMYNDNKYTISVVVIGTEVRIELCGHELQDYDISDPGIIGHIVASIVNCLAKVN